MDDLHPANRKAIDQLKRWTRTLLKPGLNDFFSTWRYYPEIGRYVDGYICPPCPNCGDEVMWYRESCWQYGADNNIEHGYRCEKCWHHWNSDTGEIWYQGMSREQFVKEWNIELTTLAMPH